MAEYQMTLMDRQRIARDTMAFWLDTNGINYEFRAGQHADFTFLHPSPEHEGDSSRTFSFANSPQDKGMVMIALGRRETGFKTALKTAALGTKFNVSRPRGLPTPVFAQSLIPNDLQRTPPGQFDKYPTISVLGRTKRTEGELSRKEQLCSMQRSKINTIQPSSRRMEVTTGRYKGLFLSCSSLARW